MIPRIRVVFALALLVGGSVSCSTTVPARPGPEAVRLPYQNPDLPLDERVEDLIGRKTVSFTLTPRQISLIDSGWERVVEPGVFEVSVGGKQPGFGGVADAATTGVVTGSFEVVGSPLRLER